MKERGFPVQAFLDKVYKDERVVAPVPRVEIVAKQREDGPKTRTKRFVDADENPDDTAELYSTYVAKSVPKIQITPEVAFKTFKKPKRKAKRPPIVIAPKKPKPIEEDDEPFQIAPIATKLLEKFGWNAGELLSG